MDEDLDPIEEIRNSAFKAFGEILPRLRSINEERNIYGQKQGKVNTASYNVRNRPPTDINIDDIKKSFNIHLDKLDGYIGRLREKLEPNSSESKAILNEIKKASNIKKHFHDELEQIETLLPLALDFHNSLQTRSNGGD